MEINIKEIREKAGYSIDEISNILKIRKKYIISLENGKLDDMPGTVYTEGYKKIYYEFFGLELPKKKVEKKIQKAKIIGGKKIKKSYIVLISLCMLIFTIYSYNFILSV